MSQLCCHIPQLREERLVLRVALERTREDTGPAVFDRIAASLKRMFAAKQPAELVRRRDEG